MLPLGLPARPPTFHLTADTATPLIETTQRQTLSVHDLDGADRDWVLESPVAKISIFNSQNLTLRLPGRVLTSTVEVFKCRNVRLIIGHRPEGDNSADDEVQPLGTLQLDPPLENVTIEYAAPQHVGKIVLAPLAMQDDAGRSTFGFSSLSVQANTTDAPTVLFDSDGVLHFPAPGAGERPVTITPGAGGFDLARQLVVSHNEEQGWRITGLDEAKRTIPSWHEE